MKNMILGLAIACLTVACASEKKASVEDTTAPAAVDCQTECSSEKAAECATKTECSSEAKAECKSAKVCPITGKEIN